MMSLDPELWKIQTLSRNSYRTTRFLSIIVWQARNSFNCTESPQLLVLPPLRPLQGLFQGLPVPFPTMVALTEPKFVSSPPEPKERVPVQSLKTI